MSMVRTAVLVLASSLAASDAFVMPGHSGLALRGNGPSVARSVSAFRATRPAARVAPTMQVEQIAEHATLLAAYPEGFVNGMTSYFNLYTAIPSPSPSTSRLSFSIDSTPFDPTVPPCPAPVSDVQAELYSDCSSGEIEKKAYDQVGPEA